MIQQHVYKFFSDYIKRFTGIVYDEKNYYRLDHRLTQLKMKLAANTYEDLVNIFRHNPPAELHTLLISTSTNNETRFLRDRAPFEVLIDKILPDLIQRKGGDLNIWSCGCSTGQEPYSIVMQYMEKYPGKNPPFKIRATDICQESLKKAKLGRYDWLEIQRGLPIFLLAKYFNQIDDKNWEIKDELKQFINFEEFNLLDNTYPVNKYDLLLCRNVLIYQTAESKKEIIAKFHKALVPGGYMLMGTGESLIGMDNIGFINKSEGTAMFFQKAL